MRRRGIWVFALVGLVAGGACSGDDDAGPSTSVSASTTDAAGPGTSAGSVGTTTPTGDPITGPLVAVSGVGFYAVDRDTGEGRRLEFAAEGVAIRIPPVVSGDTAYLFTYDTIPGQQFSQTVHLTAVDRATGAEHRVTTVGATKESDASEQLVEFDAVAVTGDVVWVRRGDFGSRARDLVAYDTVTGAERRGVTVDAAANLVSDGTALYFQADGGVRRLEPDGAVTDLITQFPTLAQLDIDPVDVAITRSGAPLAADDVTLLSDFLTLEIGPMAAGGGSLWALADGSSSTVSGELVLVEVLLQIDPATGVVRRVVPTSGFGEYFTGENEISLGDESVAYAGGAVWVVDRQSNGSLLRIDTATGAVKQVYAPCPADLRCDNGTLNTTDPDGLWLQLTRFGPTSADGSSSGPISLERIDPATGAMMRSVALADLVTG